MCPVIHSEEGRSSDLEEFAARVGDNQFFSHSSDIYVARAPGRLDVMGGIADYSGSMVLELPIAEAALVALQRTESPYLEFHSVGTGSNDRSDLVSVDLESLAPAGDPLAYEEACQRFRAVTRDSWAAYLAGAFLVLMRERGIRFDHGARILIDSKVPEGKGVSSSAAIEVATMSAISAAWRLALEPRELALLCQKVENLVVGAPCGIMDQMTSAAGRSNRLLSLLCQPAELRGLVEIPDELAVWGIDSGIRHSVGGGDYGSVRTGAFMGYRIIADLAGLPVVPVGDGVVSIDDPEWGGYLANISTDRFEHEFAGRLPERIYGQDFLARYGGTTDPVTQVSPNRIYAVKASTTHPVYESQRVREFSDLLTASITDETAKALGELMYGSHDSYSACGLGTQGTDLLVDLVNDTEDLYGAKITGGGSGGTVAVLGRRGADEAINQVVRAYETQTGYRPYIFRGSSEGAAASGQWCMSPAT